MDSWIKRLHLRGFCAVPQQQALRFQLFQRFPRVFDRRLREVIGLFHEIGNLLHRAFSGTEFEDQSSSRVDEVDAVRSGARNDASFFRGADVEAIYALRIAHANDLLPEPS